MLASVVAVGSSREPLHQEPPMKMVSGKHSIFTHFAEDLNREICKTTKFTRASCRRRAGEAVPRAEKFGDLITGDHKVLSMREVNLETLTDTQSWYKI